MESSSFVKQFQFNNQDAKNIYLGRVGNTLYWSVYTIERNGANYYASDPSVVVTDSNLKVLSARSFRVSIDDSIQIPDRDRKVVVQSMIVATNGDLIFTGFTTVDTRNGNSVTIRVNSQHVIIWKVWNNFRSDSSIFNQIDSNIQNLSSGRYLVTYSIGSVAYLTIIGTSGNTIKQISIQGNDITVNINNEFIYVSLVGRKSSSEFIAGLLIYDKELVLQNSLDFLSLAPSYVTNSKDFIQSIFSGNRLIVTIEKSPNKKYLFSLNVSIPIPSTINSIFYEEDGEYFGGALSLGLTILTDSYGFIYKRGSDPSILHKFDPALNYVGSWHIEYAPFSGFRNDMYEEEVNELIFHRVYNSIKRTDHHFSTINNFIVSGDNHSSFENIPCAFVSDAVNIVVEEKVLKVSSYTPNTRNETIRSYPFSILTAFLTYNFTTVNVCPTPTDISKSTVSSNFNRIEANGSDTAIITVSLRDASGEITPITDADVVISSSAGSLGPLVNNNDGTYHRVLTSSNSEEIAFITYTINGSPGAQTTSVTFYKEVSTSTSTIGVADSKISVSGGSTLVTVQLKDSSGANITENHNVVIRTNNRGTVSSMTNAGNGRYTAVLTSSSKEETATVSFTINGVAAANTANVFFYKEASTSTSSISVADSKIPVVGGSTIVTVQLKDSSGATITGNHNVVIRTNNRGAISSMTNAGNGRYTAVLTSSSKEETATVSFTINGVAAANTTTVFFYKEASTSTSSISVADSKIPVVGGSTIVTVQLKDSSGATIIGNHNVVIRTNNRGVISSMTNAGNGRYTAILTSSIKEETATVSFTINGAAASNTKNVFFYKNASLTKSIISVNAPRIAANGISKSTVTVQLKDSSGVNIIGNQLIKLFSTKGNLSNTTNNGDGTYTATLTSSTSEETTTLSFKIDTQFGTKTATVEFYKTASVSKSTISVSAARIVANGISKSTVTVQLKDSSGANIIGSQLIKLFSTKGNLSNTTNNGDGTYTAILTSSTSEETTTLSFKIDTQFGIKTATVEFYKTASVSKSAISVSAARILANGTSKSTITVQLKDSNGANIIGSQLIKLFSTKGSLSNTTNNGDGRYTATLTSSTSEETTTLSFKIDTQFGTKTATVEFYKTASVSKSTISVSAARIVANGISKSTVTVQLKDSSGANIIGSQLIKLFSTKGNLSNTTNNGDGTYTAILTSSTSEEIATLSFKVGTEFGTKTEIIEFYKIASISKSTIIASPTRILANGTSKSTITVQLKDSNGANIIGSQLIKLFSTKGSLSNTTNNGDGIYTAILTSSTSEETTTLSFKVDAQFGIKTATVEFYKTASITKSTISVSAPRIVANGISTSTITVQLKDSNGVNIIGSQLIKLFSTKGAISSTTNNGDGTYTATLTSSVSEETTTLSFKIDSQFGTNKAFVDFYKEASLYESIIFVSDEMIPADETSTSIITVQLRDALGNNILGNHEVRIHASKGILGSTINNNDGTFEAELTSSLFTEVADIIFTINGTIAQNSTQVIFYKEPDVTASTITADPPSILANGTAMTTITVQLRDDDGTALPQRDHNVTIDTSIGSISETINNNDGSYMAMLTSTTEPTTATLNFTLNNVLSTTTTTVRFVDIISVAPEAQVQSPHIYLQAAGSVDGDGDQSTPGIHLRWTLKNKLGDEHLPKGNLATGTANFNKPGDYVKVYRAPYVKEQLVISLEDEPQTIDHANAYWLYTINDNKYYIIFRDKDRYLALLDTIDPRNGNRLGFLEAYGDGLIEVETRDQLAFGVTLTTNQQTSTSSLQTEILSVEANRLSLAKNVIGRKTFTSTALHDTHQCGDNIRSVRFKASNCYVTTIKLELYQTFLHTTNEAQNWVSLGDFSLTISDEEAFQRLESTPDTIHGKWPRYNNNCLTNLDNYRDKWNGPREEGDRNLKQIIEKYIQLSNSEGNPRALETIDFTDPSVTDGLRDLQEVSNLNMLFLAGTDYHMARMMGLGHLDVTIEDDTQKFVYMVEYHTEADLGGSPILGGGLLNPDGVQHLYMTVPTSKQDSRLPYPVDLLKIEPGIKRIGLDQNSTLTDPNGYTDVGRQRYVSIYAKEQVEHENEDFYQTPDEFNYSEATHPVYAGISYKEKGAGNDWVKPEISSSADYLTAGPNPTSETVPLPIPLMGEPLFVHRILEEGTHEYLGYGINWFGRSNVSANTPLEIRTEFPTINLLKPPAALHALHVVEEDPLILTSASEQVRIDDNTADDPTIARLMFSYNHEQELINYPISSDDRVLFTDEELVAPDVFRPDQNEIFANEIEIFFRNSIPQNIRGKITMVEDDPLDQAVSVLTTNDYLLYSEKVKNEDTGEYEFVKIKPELPENTPETNFTGGVLILGQQQFIIHSITVAGNGYAVIKVYKKAVGEALQGNTTEGPLEGPDISGDEIFMAIENMLTIDSWGTGNPNSFKVQIPEEVQTIHRTLVETSGGSDVNELLLEKFRGIYDTSVTITPVLETSEVDENNQEIASIHRGTYKIQLSKTLAQHPQFSTTGNSVEWQGGAVRIPSEANPNGAKRTLKVVKIENVGTAEGIILYAIDDTFDQEIVDPDTDTGKIIGYQSENPIQTTGDIAVNFYPGYKIYLYADTSFGLTSDALRPSGEETLRYSIFGVRSKGDEYRYTGDNPPVFVETHYSNIGTPTNMFSQAVIPPLRPQLPAGSDYATRPDSFGKATYTLTTAFNHKPFAVQYSRADEQGVLNAIYEPATINTIKEALSSLSKDIYATSRWKNLMGFDYSEHGGEFEKFPNTENGYRFPNPDKATLFQLINRDIDKYNNEESPSTPIEPVTAGTISPGAVIIPGTGANDDTTLADYIEKTVLNVFIPLTEIPLIYDQIRTDSNYQPINRKQVIRDENGKLLKPTDDAYDIAPMAKRTVSGNQLQFTDFTLDGTSNNIYFYAVRELSSAMQMGDYSPVIGPINLVNTNPPMAPEIRRAIPRLADKNYGLKKIPLDFVSVENLTIIGDTIIHEGGVFGGAASKQILEGNAMISYQVKAESAIIIGLSEIHTNKETETVDYGFICTHKGDVIVRDKGVLTTVGTYDSNTVLQIQRIGKILYFIREGVEVYQIEIETPIDFLVTVSVRNKIATVTNLALYTSGRYYDKEVLQSSMSEALPLTLANFDNSTFSPEGILAKDTFITPIDAWDSSAISLEFIPLCGSLSFNVQANKTVAVGLTGLTNENHLEAIQYGIRTGSDGLLYVINKGEEEVMGVPYDEDSRLTVERRNQLLLLKNNGRTFYKLQLEENSVLWANFSIYSADGQISDIEINETSNVQKKYLGTNTMIPAIVLEFNGYPVNQKITALSLYRTLDPAKSSSVRSMELVKTIDVRLTGQIGQSTLSVTDEFEDLVQIPYGDAIYYRATVSREVSYTIGEGVEEKMITELAPSNASRVIISTITESSNPIAPEVFYDIDESAGDASGENMSLQWKRVGYNPTYLVYKMNTQGNWVKIHEFESNEDVVYLPLTETSLTPEELSIIDGESENVFHHFRVDVENSAGLFNITKNLITIPGDKLID